MSSPRCFIHIGVPKTGSTFLQRVLTDSTDELRRQGLLYPQSILRGYGHHDLAFLLGGGYPDWASPGPTNLEDLAHALREEVGGHVGSVLLSSEDFYLYPEPLRLREFLSRTGVITHRTPVIIAYLRRQDELHESWYNQTIKAQGCTHSLDECISRFFEKWDYSVQLRPWAEAFGSENVMVRSYEASELEGGSLLNDFMRLLALPTNGLVVHASRPNTGLNRDLLEFQRALNRLPVSVIERRTFHRELIELSHLSAGSGLFAEGPLLGVDARRQLLGRYAESNRHVEAEYRNGIPLFSGPIDVPEPCPYGELSADKIALILAWLMIKRS